MAFNTKKLKLIFQQMSTEAANTAAKIMQEKLKIAAELCVARFYASYNPKVYSRNYGLYNSFQENLSLSSGLDSAIAEVDFNSSNMGEWYHDPANYIYEMAVHNGVHGESSIAISDPILEMMNAEYQKLLGERPAIAQSVMSAVAGKYAGKIQQTIN